MADGKEIDFTPYASGGDDTADVPTTPAAPATPVIDFSKYAAPAPPAASVPTGQIDFSQVANGEQSKAQAIVAGAKALGVDPVDYATAMHYETGGTFDPWQPGPMTKWGQHRGTIQYGEPQRAQYGVTPDQSFEDQVTNSNVQYLKDHGVRPGASFQQLYAAINGGSANKNLSTQDWKTGRTIADNIAIANAEHRPEVLKRFGQYFNGAMPAADTAGDTTQPSAIQPGAPVQTPQVTPEERQAFDARFPVETYPPGYVDPNAVSPEQNVQNLTDALPGLTAVSDAALKGEKYVDPATQIVLEGGYKQAPDQTNVPQGTTRVTKGGQTYLAKQVGDQYSVTPESQATPPAPAPTPDDPQYQEYLKAGGETDSPAVRQKFAQIMQGVQATTDQANAQSAANPNVQRLMTRFQASNAPLDDVHFRNTEIPYLITIPDGVNKEQFAKEAANQQLQNEWGLTPEQTAKLNWKVPTLEKGQNQVIAYVRRGDIADAVGVDKVKSDYYGEMPAQGLDPQQNEQRAAAQPLTDNPFVRPTGNPLMDQARANIAADPFNAGTDKDVQNEYERLQRTAPGEDQKQAADTVGSWLSKIDLSGLDTGFVKGAAWLNDIATGVTKLSPIGLLDWGFGTHVADQGTKASNLARLVATSSSDHDTNVFEIGGEQIRPRAVGEAIGEAAVQVPTYVALSTLPGGAVMAMAATEGLGSVGRGDNALEVGKNTLKGGALGLLFGAAPRVGKFLEDTVLSATGAEAKVSKTLLDEQMARTMDGVQLPAEVEMNPGLKAQATDYISEKAQDEAEKQMLVKTLLDPSLLRTTPKDQLIAKLVGSAAELGTIGGGTFSIEKVSGASNEDAFKSAIVNTLFGLTKYVPLAKLAGKVYRMRDGEQSTDVTIDPSGSVKELPPGAVPPGAVDAEIVLPPAGAPQRTAQIQPEAKTSIDSNPLAADIVKALQGKDSGLTNREIMRQTGAPLEDINSTLAELYSAGAVEQMPKSEASGNRIRLIDENDVSKSLLAKPAPEPPPPTTPPATSGTTGFDPNETLDASKVQPFLESLGITGKDARNVARGAATFADGASTWTKGDLLQKARELGLEFNDPGATPAPATEAAATGAAQTADTTGMPAKRIEQPLPDAIQRLPLDTRAQKIGQALKDGNPLSVEEIAKATKYNPAKVNETIETLYAAGKVEILPDSRVRLIEPLEKGATSLYERFNEKGVSTPAVEEAPSSTKSEQATGNTAPVASPSGIAPTATENGIAPEATTEKSADKTTTPVAPTYNAEEFGLPFLDRSVPRNRLSLQKEIDVKYETPTGNSFTRRMTVEDRQRQLQQKHGILEKLLDCVNG